MHPCGLSLTTWMHADVPRLWAFLFLGTGGLLVLAKRRGLLPSVSETIAKLRHAGLWLSDDIAQVLRAQAGE